MSNIHEKLNLEHFHKQIKVRLLKEKISLKNNPKERKFCKNN